VVRKWFLWLAHTFASRQLFGLTLLTVLLIVRIWDPFVLEEVRLRTFDLYQNLAPRIPTVHPVVIVDIDEASLSALGQWPWPRTMVADLLDRLYEMQSAAIGFDIVFPESDRTSPKEIIKQLRSLDDETRQRVAELPSNDVIFADAINRGTVVLGQSGTHAANTSPSEHLPATGFAIIGPDPTPHLIAFPHLLRNVAVLERAAAGRGLFSIGTERDGIVRRVPIVMTSAGKIVPGLVLELLRAVTRSETILIRADATGTRSVAVPGLELPTDRNGRVWLHFAPHDPARFVSAKDVLNGSAPSDKFAGKIVLVGTSAIGLLDVKTTPLDPAMPGVEVHAQLLEAALTDSLLVAPGYAIIYEMIAALIFGVVLSLLASRTTVLVLFMSAIIASAIAVEASWIAFSRYNFMVDPTFPLLTAMSVFMSLVLIGYFREQLDRRRIRAAFAQYLSPTLVERLAQSPKRLVLGGEDRMMTVLFSDVRGFTTISETYKDDPQGLTALMNRLLTPLTSAIIARNGTIDKYMGDAVMAFWNAPLDDPNQESDACHAALDMLERVEVLNEERERELAGAGGRFMPLKVGIGINTGRCTVGNMGSDLRFQYTVMGDSVNLASRLEGQTKNYELPIIVGSRTAAAVSQQFAILEVESIRVKGKTEAEVIYTILGRDDVAKMPEFPILRERWGQVLICYRKQDWAGALKAIDACRSLCNKFGLVTLLKIYEERVGKLQETPPAAHWDGVFIADEK
jgi:adenylate cyclase